MIGWLIVVGVLCFAVGYALGQSGMTGLLKVMMEVIHDNARLRRGDFTEAEFQNLCHNFSECDKERFKQGCREYQAKLFGE